MTSRKRRRERAARFREVFGTCRNCGEVGVRHFVPPGFGSPGMYICTKKDEHDPRCISLTDSKFNNHCDCRTLAAIDRDGESPEDG